jgi:transcriptional regulator with XRE-family HTH domain
MIGSYITDCTFQENISLDDIANRIGFQKSMGSRITTANLSKLSNRINKLIKVNKLNVPKLALSTLNNSKFFKEVDNATNNKIYTVCVSFSQYQRFVVKHNYFMEYYKGAEKVTDGYIQHCLTLIILKTEPAPKYIIIDPNIELENKNIAIDVNQIEQKYNNKVITTTKEEIQTLLTMRYDGMDDDNIIIGLNFEGNSKLDIY